WSQLHSITLYPSRSISFCPPIAVMNSSLVIESDMEPPCRDACLFRKVGAHGRALAVVFDEREADVSAAFNHFRVAHVPGALAVLFPVGRMRLNRPVAAMDGRGDPVGPAGVSVDQHERANLTVNASEFCRDLDVIPPVT